MKADEGWFYALRNGGGAIESTTQGDPLVTTTKDARLWAALVEAGEQGLTYPQIDELAGLSVHTAKKRYPEWRKAGKICPKGSGAKGDPYRWVIKGL